MVEQPQLREIMPYENNRRAIDAPAKETNQEK